MEKILNYNQLLGTTRSGYYIEPSGAIVPAKDATISPTTMGLIPSKEYAEALAALFKLLMVRREYVGNWIPENSEIRYSITSYLSTVEASYDGLVNSPLTFPSLEMAEEFVTNNKELLLEAIIVL